MEFHSGGIMCSFFCLVFSSVAHPGIQPGYPGHLRSPQSAWHAWHPGGVGWYRSCGFGEERKVRALISPQSWHVHRKSTCMCCIYMFSHPCLLCVSSSEVMLPCKLLPWLHPLGSLWLEVCSQVGRSEKNETQNATHDSQISTNRV